MDKMLLAKEIKDKNLKVKIGIREYDTLNDSTDSPGVSCLDH